MEKMILVFLVLISVTACSSKRKVKDIDNSSTIARDYEVRDASSVLRPGWIEDAEIWVEQEKMDTQKYRYFAFETEPKVSREIACNLAKANTRADIASEITTFIQKSIAQSEEGKSNVDQNNPKLEPMREFVQNNLAERVQSLVHGAAPIKTYWEKRQYLKKLGAKKDFVAYTCASLVRIDSERLKAAIEKASEEVVKKVEDTELKNNVKKTLENLDESFQKARQGEA